MNEKTDTQAASVHPVVICATEHDHRMIDAVSFSLDGRVGDLDDIERLRNQIERGDSTDKLKTACEIAVAFIRWSQDLKHK